MADALTPPIKFEFKELATLMIKEKNIHEGYWGVYLEFGIQGANVGPSPVDWLPCALVPVLKFGLQKFEQESSLSVDAAKVNPKPTSKKPKKGEKQSIP
jgi:hypothetical protein